jgi:hypothetical protein
MRQWVVPSLDRPLRADPGDGTGIVLLAHVMGVAIRRHVRMFAHAAHAAPDDEPGQEEPGWGLQGGGGFDNETQVFALVAP